MRKINKYNIELSIVQGSKLVTSRFTISFLDLRNDVDYKTNLNYMINELCNAYKQLKKKELNKTEVTTIAVNSALVLLKLYIEKIITFDYDFELYQEYTDNILFNLKLEKHGIILL